jgi:MoaA/NifB/PqqE/SkfB family radical SAM enzyme
MNFVSPSPAAFRSQYAKTGVLRDVVVDLEVTSVCDAVCGFCPREVMPDTKRFISDDVVARLAGQMRDTPPQLVTLCGIGESLLHPRLNAIVQTLSDTGVRIEMTTHGRRVDVPRFEELVAHGLRGVNFSVNAATAETHRAVMRLKDFHETVANIEQVAELRARRYPHVAMHVSFVVCSLNQHEVDGFVEYWRRKGLSQIWLHPVNNRNGLRAADLAPADMTAIAARYAGDRQVRVDVFGDIGEDADLCKVAKKLIFISADGEMRLCAMDYRRVTSYGNVLHQGLEDMHRERLLRYLRGEMNTFCAGCDFCPAAIGKDGVAAHG